MSDEKMQGNEHFSSRSDEKCECVGSTHSHFSSLRDEKCSFLCIFSSLAALAPRQCNTYWQTPSVVQQPREHLARAKYRPVEERLRSERRDMKERAARAERSEKKCESVDAIFNRSLLGTGTKDRKP